MARAPSGTAPGPPGVRGDRKHEEVWRTERNEVGTEMQKCEEFFRYYRLEHNLDLEGDWGSIPSDPFKIKYCKWSIDALIHSCIDAFMLHYAYTDKY